VYGRGLDDVLAWPFLRQELINSNARGRATTQLSLVEVLIYDNSPQPQAKPCDELSNCTYVHNPNNGGTASAYVFACNYAAERGIEWLLLLDHDTLLPVGFFDAATAALTDCLNQPCALVPWIKHDAHIISPARVTKFGTIAPLSNKSLTSSVERLTAIASGAVLFVPLLASAMPMPEKLWLDYVDHWLFLRLQNDGSAVVIFDACVKHDLSICDLGSLSEQRLIGILEGEAAFIQLLGFIARIFYPFRLVVRLIRYTRKQPRLAFGMLKWVCRRAVREI
jgi:GT2 family glycosyltransferase